MSDLDLDALADAAKWFTDGPIVLDESDPFTLIVSEGNESFPGSRFAEFQFDDAARDVLAVCNAAPALIALARRGEDLSRAAETATSVLVDRIVNHLEETRCYDPRDTLPILAPLVERVEVLESGLRDACDLLRVLGNVALPSAGLRTDAALALTERTRLLALLAKERP